jgi:hypothetical protein
MTAQNLVMCRNDVPAGCAGARRARLAAMQDAVKVPLDKPVAQLARAKQAGDPEKPTTGPPPRFSTGRLPS